jgi:hypothetical protein
VVGGKTRAAGGDDVNVDDVEVHDLNSFNENCKDLERFPVRVDAAVASFVGGKLMVCGGSEWTQGQGEIGPLRNCYSINDANDLWRPEPSMSEARQGAAASVVENIWFITGGSDANKEALASTEYFDGSIFRPGPPMPVPNRYHCQVSVNDTHIFFAGGVTTDTFMLDWSRQSWIFLDSLPALRNFPACGLVNGVDVVLTSDGTTSIFSLTSQKWRAGKALPAVDRGAVGVQMAESFLVVGGKDDTSSLDTVYEFNSVSYEWNLKTLTLDEPKYSVAAVGASDDFAICQ